MSQRLRIGVDPYAVGFILNKEQMAEIATRAVPSSYLDQHGRDPVLVLKWHVDEHHFEILDTIDARRFFFAIHVYPWHVEVSRAYPKFLGYPYFLQSYIEGVVMDHKLGDLLEPNGSPVS
ncbi:hypothetical protein B0H11DRAFT_2249565 [Mycena galericulata]|nr:hypothetical protein B0H11DRAFT_2249565 [Mycena galericulata]